MEIKQSRENTKPRLQLAIHMARKNCNVFVDSSFSQKSEHRAGAGSIITNPKRHNNIALIQAFNMSNMNIDDSKHAELWGATLILEQLKNFNVQKLTFDCSFVKSRILDVLNNKLNEEKYNGDLFDRLRGAVANQNDMALCHVDRKETHIKLVDSFSRVATKKQNVDRISAIVDQHGAPFILHHMNDEGYIARTMFFDAPDPMDAHHPI